MKRAKRSKPEKVAVGNVTVKIYKRRRATASGEFRTIYEVSDYTGGQRRLRGFADHEAARTEADKIARQIATGDATAATMRNSEAASYGRAIEILAPTGISLELAASLVAESFKTLGCDRMIEAAKFLAQHKPENLESKPVAVVVAELVALKLSRGMSADYTNDLRQRLTRFADKHSVEISSVTTGDLQRWLDGLKLGTQSVKNFRTVLHTLFEFAEARGYIFKGGNPVVGTESVKVNGGAIEIFTRDELAKLLKGASEDFRPLVNVVGSAWQPARRPHSAGSSEWSTGFILRGQVLSDRA